MAVLGVDATARGWVGVRLDDRGGVTVTAAPTIAELAGAIGDIDLVAIDIPIGLPVAGPRAADLAARKFVGARRSSVFTTPVREALRAGSYPEANAISKGLTDRGISQQAYALRFRIQEVENWIGESVAPVREVHPEVSFTVLADNVPMHTSKKTWAGFCERRSLLRSVGIDLPDDIGPAGPDAGADDVLDAAVAAWSAQRILAGRARTFPSPPERLPDGSELAIWA